MSNIKFKKVKTVENILIVQVPRNNMPFSKYEEYLKSIKTNLDNICKETKIFVCDSSIKFTYLKVNH